MTNEIAYQGITTQPSDYHSADGSMSVAINLVPEQGGLAPLPRPKVVSKFNDMVAGQSRTKYSVEYIHKTSSYTNYILTKDTRNALYLLVDLESSYSGSFIERQRFSSFSSTIIEITSIGNTLIVNATDGLHYFLFKDSKYSYLGQHLPEIPISFGLKGEEAKAIRDNVSYDTLYRVTLPDSIVAESLFRPDEGEERIINNDNDDVLTRCFNTAISKVNRFIATESVDKGKFIFPFLVRYAFRLFDGTTTMASSPVLMLTDTGTCPHAIIEGYYHNEIFYNIHAMAYDLMYVVEKNESYKNEIKKWSDIIKSVDIFVSAPIYKYDQSGNVKGVSCYDSVTRGFSVGCPTFDRVRKPGESDSPVGETHDYFKFHANSQFAYTGNRKYREGIWAIDGGGLLGLEELVLPTHESDKVERSIKDCNLFYLLESIDIDDLNFINSTDPSSSHKPIKVGKEFLGDGLYARETLQDDYDSHDSFIPSFVKSYNSRLHFANLSKRIADPFVPSTYVPYESIYKPYNDDDFRYESDDELKSKYTVYIHTMINGEEVILKNPDGTDSVLSFHTDFPFLYMYCPDRNAFKATIYSVQWGRMEYGERKYFELPLRRHGSLNGSFYFAGFDVPLWSETTSISETTDEKKKRASIPNKLYVSEVGNPFVFPVTGINTIGAGEIIGIATAARELSQGQFGQFPLYALCTDGVWALSTTDTGGYSAVQPITRDVCVSNKSIVSTDSEVLFATSRGIMRLSGSSSECISDVIMSHHAMDFGNGMLPHISTLHDFFHGQDSSSCKTCLTQVSFESFLSDCRMIYDYVHQRIIVFNPTLDYVYVLSLQSGQWGMMLISIKSAINSYPDAMAMDADSQLVNFCNYQEDETKGMFITRPIKMGLPDAIKSVNTIIQRGYFRKGNLNTVLYGSRDNINWHLIGSSTSHMLRYLRGSGYKYFRVAGVTTLNIDESVSGFTTEFTPRHINVLH